MIRLFIFPTALVSLMLAFPHDSHANGTSAPTPPTCTEGQPCWNWAVMGNHKRAVVTLDGDPRVVGPCQFNRLWALGKIRYHVRFDGRTYHTLTRMHGDTFARTLTDCPWRNR